MANKNTRKTQSFQGEVFKEKENKNFFNIIHLPLRRINFFTMTHINPLTDMPQTDPNDHWSASRRELYDLEAVRSVSSRTLNRGRFRTNERRSLSARKEPRSITPLHERRKSIDLGTEAAARKPRRNQRWIRSLRHRARRIEARELPRGIDIFKSSRTYWGSLRYVLSYIIFVIITSRDTSVFEMECYIILLRRLQERDVLVIPYHILHFICNYYVLSVNI